MTRKQLVGLCSGIGVGLVLMVVFNATWLPKLTADSDTITGKPAPVVVESGAPSTEPTDVPSDDNVKFGEAYRLDYITDGGSETVTITVTSTGAVTIKAVTDWSQSFNLSWSVIHKDGTTVDIISSCETSDVTCDSDTLYAGQVRRGKLPAALRAGDSVQLTSVWGTGRVVWS